MSSGRVRGAGRSEGVELWASMASGLGLADTEVFVGGMEATDTTEELLDMADGVLETGSVTAIPFRFSGPGRRECWRPGKTKSPSGSGAERATMVMMEGDQPG